MYHCENASVRRRRFFCLYTSQTALSTQKTPVAPSRLIVVLDVRGRVKQLTVGPIQVGLNHGIGRLVRRLARAKDSVVHVLTEEREAAHALHYRNSRLVSTLISTILP